MSLALVATPLGHPDDITLRALNELKACDVVIGEEFREVSTLLKRLEIIGKKMEVLNEHSKPEDITPLLELCRTQRVALVSDCGTPGFCDPGAQLVAACRQAGIAVTSLPGASSLMPLLSMAGAKVSEFVFCGFLPANREERTQALRKLRSESRAMIFMDTPYRLGRLLEELALLWPERKALIGLDLTLPEERYLHSPLRQLHAQLSNHKAEFVLLVYSSASDENVPRR